MFDFLQKPKLIEVRGDPKAIDVLGPLGICPRGTPFLCMMRREATHMGVTHEQYFPALLGAYGGGIIALSDDSKATSAAILVDSLARVWFRESGDKAIPEINFIGQKKPIIEVHEGLGDEIGSATRVYREPFSERILSRRVHCFGLYGGVSEAYVAHGAVSERLREFITRDMPRENPSYTWKINNNPKHPALVR